MLFIQVMPSVAVAEIKEMIAPPVKGALEAK